MVVHWNLCTKNNFTVTEKSYDHKVEKELESEEVKILWDFRVQTHKVSEHSTPDIVVLNNTQRKCSLTDITCPFDTRVDEKEQEKVEKY